MRTDDDDNPGTGFDEDRFRNVLELLIATTTMPLDVERYIHAGAQFYAWPDGDHVEIGLVFTDAWPALAAKRAEANGWPPSEPPTENEWDEGIMIGRVPVADLERKPQVEAMTDDELQRQREHAGRQLFDVLAVSTEHEDITNVQAFRKMCESAITVYEGTDDQHVADWAREALRVMDERGL
jgi:hypothetical protein